MRYNQHLEKHRGFTLAELLIALAILGVIATFTIPKILTSQNDAKRIAVFKETIAALNVTLQQGLLEGVVSDSTLGTYYLTHLNAIKICTSNANANGCWDPTTPDIAGQNNQGGVVLASGAFIAGLDDASSGTGADTILIDWNGLGGPNVEGDDIMVVRAIITNATITDRVSTVRGDSSQPTSLALWNKIFQ